MSAPASTSPPASTGPPRTVAEVLEVARTTLREAGVASPAVDARLLFMHVLGWAPHELTVRSGEELAGDRRAAVDAAIARRADRVPLQHITGTCGFRHVELRMQPGVFIPRPETELLVDLAIAAAPPGGLVVEPCTGSGAVAAALADERSDVRIVATDIDTAAVALARFNTRAYADRVTVQAGDLLTPIDTALRGRVHVLVSNPPYLADGELQDLEPEVSQSDPLQALVSGPSGHEVSDRLIADAVQWLAPGGMLILELDPRRTAQGAARCAAAGLGKVTVTRDLTGRPRVVSAIRQRL